MNNKGSQIPTLHPQKASMNKEDEVMIRMKSTGIPITRENYINYIYPASYGVSDFWCAELEMTLPEELQDSSDINKR